MIFRNQSIYSIDLQRDEANLLAVLPVSGSVRLFGRCRFFARMLRLDPKCVARLSEYKYVICVQGKLCLLDMEKKCASVLREMRKGYGTLNFCEADDGIYYGDYGRNPGHDEINIYHIDNDLNHRTVFTFPKGCVRHVHNIIRDGDGYIVLAGDNEPMAGIYRANSDWSDVKPWCVGEQRYRAVMGFPYDGGLLYATDSVETENHIRLIGADGDEHVLTGINGSCINGCEIKDYYLFSTTVEPHEGGGFRHKFTYRLGGGIKNREVHIVAVNKKDLTCRVVKRFKKDFWPMGLLQYGCVRFAGGQGSRENDFWCSPVACKGVDGRSVLVKINGD